MKIREMLKKVIASFLLTAIMLMPTMVMAKDGDNAVSDEEEHGLANKKDDQVVVDVEEKDEEVVEEKDEEVVEEKDEELMIDIEEIVEEEDDNKLEKNEEKGNVKASDIKLLERIKFTGILHKNPKCGASYGTYTEQLAVVTEISHRNEGVLGVSFIKSGKIISSFGYILVEGEEGDERVSKVEKAGKILSLKLNLFPEKEGAKIEINGTAYEIDKNTSIELVNGGIKINDNFIKLEEGTIIKFVDLNGAFALDYDKTEKEKLLTFRINGNATLEITNDGFIIEGEASFNGEEVKGKVKVTFKDEVEIKLVDSEIDGNRLNPSNFKSFLSNLIKKIIDFIKEAVSKLLPF